MAEFDEFTKDYSDQINAAIAFSGQSHDFYTKVKAEYLTELLEGELPGSQTLRVLDVGCGHGIIHPFLTQPGSRMEITGIDVAATVIEEARLMHPGIDYDVYDGSRLPYEDASFDAAFTICVMHHVPPPEWPGFLAEMRRVVRPGGVVAVFEHNPYNPVTKRIVDTCPIDKNAVLLKSGELKELARQTGLKDVASRFILFTPFDKPIFKRFDRGMGWLPLGAQYFVAGSVPG
jgi:ubiquinone/menaquinone biosynthesis C-methylase UbiE